MKKAFTLIELLVVIAFIAIFALIIASVFLDKSTYRVDGQTIKPIDGCEYIQTYGDGGRHYTHKGNCTNKIHSYNQ